MNHNNMAQSLTNAQMKEQLPALLAGLKTDMEGISGNLELLCRVSFLIDKNLDEGVHNPHLEAQLDAILKSTVRSE